MLLNKRTGHQEEFDRRKLERSLNRAGASQKMARKIATRINHSKVETTAEVRESAILQIREIDPFLARRYESTRSLAVRESMETVKGTCRLHIETLNELGAKRGRTATVEHKGREKTLVIEAGSVQKRWMQMSISDIREMRVREGMRLAVRIHGPCEEMDDTGNLHGRSLDIPSIDLPPLGEQRTSGVRFLRTLGRKFADSEETGALDQLSFR